MSHSEHRFPAPSSEGRKAVVNGCLEFGRLARCLVRALPGGSLRPLHLLPTPLLSRLPASTGADRLDDTLRLSRTCRRARERRSIK